MESYSTYTIGLKRKPNWIITIYLLICILVWAFILSGFIYSAIDWGIFTQIAFPILCLILAGLFIIDRILWQIKGKECITISDKFEIVKRGKLLKSRNTIELNEITLISFSDDKKEVSFMARVYGLRGGKITIHYLGRKIRVGQNLSMREAEILSKEISAEFKRANLLRPKA